MTRIIISCYLLLTLLSGCVSSPYYQKSFNIPNNKWAQDFKPNFIVDIDDTSVHYNIHFIIRHTNLYAYSNIWLWVSVKQPGETTFTRTRIEIPLANLQGRWLGEGMGEIYEQRRMIVLNHNEIPVTDALISISEESINQLFSKKGRYEIRLEQNMREQSLADVLHIGIRIEKSSKKKASTISVSQPKSGS
ncbi:MAG: gliding motility lipoprotein GldH [Phycisphaerales bacterium]|nr:gliding motility lipoprotein GldH [Phycisphaerales bacterium]